MTDKYIPAVGTSGYYDLLTPFGEQVNTNERYTLKSVRTISDYIANNEDVKTNVYTANNIEADYENDVKNDTEILSIQSERGHWLHVPVTYVKCYPVVNGVPYRTMSVVVPLQPLPVDTDLSSLLSSMNDLVTAKLGFGSNVKLVETSKVVLVSTVTHANTQLARELTRNPYTEAEQISILQNDLNVAITKIQALEAYIFSLSQ